LAAVEWENGSDLLGDVEQTWLRVRELQDDYYRLYLVTLLISLFIVRST
jgi:hypothetical protein